MSSLENLNWKLKERALLNDRRSDCELEGATLSPIKPTNPIKPTSSPTPNDLAAIAQAPRIKRNPYGTSTDRDTGWQNEPDPTMPSFNPFVQARNIKGKQQSEVATALSLDVIDIIRLEQGILTTIPKSIADYYRQELDIPKGWEAGYRMFQQLMRRSAPRSIHGVWKTPPGELNFRRFRIYNWPTLSQIGWCKAFCVHPSSLYAIEKNPKQALPYDIMNALIDGNVMSEEQARQFAFRIRQAASLKAA